MGEHGHTPDAVNEGDDLLSGGIGFGFKGGTPITDIAVEGFVFARDQSVCNHGCGDMGTSQRAAISLIEDLFEIDVQSHIVERLDDGDTPLVAGLERGLKGHVELVVTAVYTVGKDMNFAILDVGT